MNFFDKDGVGTRAPRGMDKSWEGRRVEGLEMIGFVEADLRQKYFSDDQKNRNIKPQSIENDNCIGENKSKSDNKVKNTINNRSIKSSGSMKLINNVNVKKFTDDDESLKLMSKYYNKSICCSNHSADAKESINKKSDGSIFNRLIMNKKSKNNDNRKCQSDVTVNKINKGSNNIINSVDLNFQCSHTSCSNNKQLKDRTAFFESFPGDGGSIKANNTNSLFKNISSCNKDKSFNKKTNDSNIVNSSKSTHKSSVDKTKQLEVHLLQLLKQLTAEKQQSKQDKLLIWKLQQQVSRSKAEDSSKDFLMMELQKEKKKRVTLEEEFKKLNNNNSALHQHVNCCCQTDVTVLKKENTRLNEVLQDLMASKSKNERAVVDLQQQSRKLQNNVESMLEDNDLLRREISSLEGLIDKCDVCKRVFNGKSIRLNNYTSGPMMKQTAGQTTSSPQGKQSSVSSLQEELAMLKVQNQDLKLRSEDQMRQYSSCFSDVTSQILKALVIQKNLKQECLSLRNQLDSSLLHNNNLKALLFSNLNNNNNSNFNNNNNFNLTNPNFTNNSFNVNSNVNNMVLSNNSNVVNINDNVNNNMAPLLNNNTNTMGLYNRICYNNTATINNIINNDDVNNMSYSNKVISKYDDEISKGHHDKDYNVNLFTEKNSAFIRKDDNNNTTLLNFNDNRSLAMNNYLNNNNSMKNYNRDNGYNSNDLTYNNTNMIPNISAVPFNIINANSSQQNYPVSHHEVSANQSQGIITNVSPVIGGILANQDGGEGPADEESDFEFSESSSVNEILDFLLDTQATKNNIASFTSNNINGRNDVQNSNINNSSDKNKNIKSKNLKNNTNKQNNQAIKSQQLYMTEDVTKRSSSHKPNTAASGDVCDDDEDEEEEDGVYVQYMKSINETNMGVGGNTINEGIDVNAVSRNNNNNNRDSNNNNNMNRELNNNHNNSRHPNNTATNNRKVNNSNNSLGG